MTEPMRPNPTDATDMADQPAVSPANLAASPANPAGSRRTRDGWQKASDTGSLVWGFILLAIGGWFFIEHTLGYDLPRIDWGTVWPIVLIVIGGWIILRAAGRRSA